MKIARKYFTRSLFFLLTFILWTLAIRYIDVQAIGPRNSVVGFAAINRFVHAVTGVHMTLYTITDWLGLIPVAFGFGFAILGLVQWICRKNIFKVDFDILMLGVFYITMLGVYLFFEKYVINYRPVLIANYLEASYPSSTTLLVMCVMPTSILQLSVRIRSKALKVCVLSALYAFTIFMVAGRLISGVHWLTDIIGSGLLSAGLITLYQAVCALGQTGNRSD